MILLTAVVAEDDWLVLPVVTTVLEDAGFDVSTATDTDSALQLLEESKGKFDLLFADVVMAGSFDGLYLARIAEWRWPKIAIVVSSGRTVNRASLPHDAMFLPKPFTGDQILSSVRRAMLRKGRLGL